MNASGQLGNGTTTNTTSPGQAGSATNWSAIAAGVDFAVAVTADGGLWTWGDNASGQLGNGTTTSATSPGQIMSGFTVLPTVTSTVPANNATDVEKDSSMTATFSTDMDATTITSSTFTLSGGVTGSVGYDAPTRTATFTPSSNLDTNTLYTATITTGVKDINGNAMASNYTWTFTTEQKKDKLCFIATAAYGSPLDRHVAALRSFRDTYLMTNRAGRAFVEVYYRYSPPFACVIAPIPRSGPRRRWALTPLVYGVVHPFVLVFIPPLSVAVVYLERKRRRRRER